MKNCTVNILGSEWSVKFGTVKEYSNLEDMDGYTDASTREIIVDIMEAQQDAAGSKKDLIKYRMEVLRHEIIHAFLFESGLASNTMSTDNLAVNEEMVDWFAIQAPKIFMVFAELEII